MKRRIVQAAPADAIQQIVYADRRLCLKNVDIDMTRDQIKHCLIPDFPGVTVYMPPNTQNKKRHCKLVFVDFQRPWEAKVARRLINLIKYRGIVADFSVQNEKVPTNDRTVPQLIERYTRFEAGSIPEDASCAYCLDKNGRLVCEVCATMYCATFYCNEDHQGRDWARHKYDCRPLPKLKLATEIAEALAKDDDKPKAKFFIRFEGSLDAGDSVVITHVASERVLYVRPANCAFDKLIADMDAHGQKAGKVTERPEVNDTLLAPLDGSFRRVQVLDVFNETDLSCFFVDFGLTRRCSWLDLRQLSYRKRSMARFTCKVILEDVLVDSTAEMKNFLEAMKANQEKLEMVKAETRGMDLFVVLKQQTDEKTVNERIRQMASFDEPMDDDSCFTYDESNLVKIPTGNNIKLRVIDVQHLGDGFISCMSAEQSSTFWQRDVKLNDYGNSRAPTESYDPMLNELCMVKHDDRWERAAIVKLNSKDVKVKLIDRYVFANIQRDNVRQLPSTFAKDPSFAQLCFVEQIDEKNVSVAKEKLKPRTNIVADSVVFNDDKKCLQINFNFLDVDVTSIDIE